MYTFLSYFFYLVSAIAGYMAAFDLLVQVFPDYGIIELTTGFFVTLMFFLVVPLYPGIDNGEWLLAIVCYVSIMLAVI